MNANIYLSRARAQWRARFSSHPGRKWFILWTVLLGATMSALDVSIVSVAMPTLKRGFNVSMGLIEWVAVAYMLALTIFLPLFGRLADIYGKSKLYNIGFVVFSAGSLLCGLAPSAEFLIGARVLQAMGAGLLQANSVAIITQAFPATERGKAIGIQGAVQAVAMAVAPFLGGILITAVGWRAIFYVNIPIGMLGMVAALLILPADAKKQHVRVDYLGAALFAAGLGSLLLALNEAVKLGWESHTILAYFVCGVIMLALFVVTELKEKEPLIDLRLFKNSTFLLGNISGMLSYYVLFALMFLMPFYLERVRSYSVALTGVLLMPLLLAMAVAAPVAGRIADRYGSRIISTVGMLISALACLWLFYRGESANLSGIVGLMIFFGLGLGIFIPSNNSAIMGVAPVDKLGMAGGLLNMTRSLGLIFGVNISGLVFTSLEHGYLAANGFPNASRIFSNSNIPMTLKDNAFMHGFMTVVLILLAVNMVAAVLSATRKSCAVGVVDHDMTCAIVVSSGFFGGFNQQTTGMAILVLILLLAGYVESFSFTRPRIWSTATTAPTAISSTVAAGRNGPAPTDTQRLALDYYARKFNDRDVSIDTENLGNHAEADVYKYGFLVKRLDISGGKVSEEKTGIRDFIIDQLLFAVN